MNNVLFQPIERTTSVDMSIFNAVTNILGVAIFSNEMVNIEVKYDASIHALEVKVFDLKTDYHLGTIQKFGCAVDLDSYSALEQLKVLKDRLIEAAVEFETYGEHVNA